MIKNVVVRNRNVFESAKRNVLGRFRSVRESFDDERYFFFFPKRGIRESFEERKFFYFPKRGIRESFEERKFFYFPEDEEIDIQEDLRYRVGRNIREGLRDRKRRSIRESLRVRRGIRRLNEEYLDDRYALGTDKYIGKHLIRKFY